jgi:NAD(P)-dependent dehydrogenase (short-subunit alcohol dehydrogenase family)
MGARVVVSARRAEKLAELADEPGVIAVAADATSKPEVEGLLAAATEELGGLDAVLYVAGRGSLAPLDQTDPEAWAQDYAVNVIGANLVCAAALPHLQPDGVIAIVSSRGPLDTHWGLASYTSSKAALDNAIKAWRVEHPERRFLRIVMGNTNSTEFASAYDMDLLMQALTHWGDQGIDGGLMELDDVGAQLARAVGLVLAEPGVDLPEIRFDARGTPRRAT